MDANKKEKAAKKINGKSLICENNKLLIFCITLQKMEKL